MRFINKIRKMTNNANSVERKYPQVAKVIKTSAARGNKSCAMHLTPEQIEALRAEGFKVSEAPYLFDYYVEW